VTEAVFLPLLMHRKKRSVGYTIAPGLSPDETRMLTNNPTWRILRNDKDCQAVSFADGTTMISFYSPGSLQFDKNSISVDQPCLVLIKKGKLLLSNPMHDKRNVAIKYGESTLSIPLPDNGYTVKASH
jgi:chondroitin AC lyase